MAAVAIVIKATIEIKNFFITNLFIVNNTFLDIHY